MLIDRLSLTIHQCLPYIFHFNYLSLTICYTFISLTLHQRWRRRWIEVDIECGEEDEVDDNEDEDNIDDVECSEEDEDNNNKDEDGNEEEEKLFWGKMKVTKEKNKERGFTCQIFSNIGAF